MGENRTGGVSGEPPAVGPTSWLAAEGAYTRDMLGWKDHLSGDPPGWEPSGAPDLSPGDEEVQAAAADALFGPRSDPVASGTRFGLPDTEIGIVVRTDFSDEETWRAVARDVLVGQSMFPGPIRRALVRVAGDPEVVGDPEAADDALAVLQQEEDPSLMVVDDGRFDRMTPERVRQVMGAGDRVFLADSVTMTHPEHVLLALQPGSADHGSRAPEDFRLTPGSVDGVSVMLQVGKLLWEEFIDERDDDGVLRRE